MARGSNNVSVLLNDGNGTFTAPADYGAGIRPRWVTSADFNHDGRADLVVANGVDGNVSVFLNTTKLSPTDISLSNSNISDGQPAATAVGSFSTADPDGSSSFTYALVSGPGGDDNSKFTVSGNILQTGAVFDYGDKNIYSIRVRSIDIDGLYTEKTLTINLVPGAGPTDISLSNAMLADGQAAGAVVGTLGTNDPDPGDVITFSLVAGTGSDDNAAFIISGNVLKTAVHSDYPSKSSYSVRVRASDAGAGPVEKVFTIRVAVAPYGIRVSLLTGKVGSPIRSGSATDFGTVRPGRKSVRTFTATNTGSMPLKLGAIKVSKGFTVLGALPKKLAPGKSATFKLQFVGNREGTWRGALRFTTNDPLRNPYVISISATCKRPHGRK